MIFPDGFGVPPKRPSRREIEIADLVSHGLSGKEIAYKLGISERAVSTHRMRLLEKFEVHSTGHLMRLMFEQGYLSMDKA